METINLTETQIELILNFVEGDVEDRVDFFSSVPPHQVDAILEMDLTLIANVNSSNVDVRAVAKAKLFRNVLQTLLKLKDSKSRNDGTEVEEEVDSEENEKVEDEKQKNEKRRSKRNEKDKKRASREEGEEDEKEDDGTMERRKNENGRKKRKEKKRKDARDSKSKVPKEALERLQVMSSEEEFSEQGVARDELNSQLVQCKEQIESYIKLKPESGDSINLSWHYYRIFQLLGAVEGGMEISTQELIEHLKSVDGAENLRVIVTLHRNFKFIISYLLWKQISKEGSLSEEEKMELYKKNWMAVTNMKPHGKSTRDKYAKVAKWMHQFKWGIFVDADLVDLVKYVKLWQGLLASHQGFQIQAQALTKLMEDNGLMSPMTGNRPIVVSSL
jgi:hypothetical protein